MRENFMIKRGAIALLMALAAPLAARALTADELIARNLEARGGAEKIAAINTVKMSGIMKIGDFELTTVSYVARDQGFRSEGSLQGFTIVQAYDGSQGWQIQPFEGRRDAEKMSDDDAGSLADQMAVEGVLLSAKRKGSAVTSLGTEDLDGTLAYKLRVVEQDGDEYTYFLDPDTFLEVKMVEKRRLRGAEQEFEYELGDYERVAGVYFPLSIEISVRGSPQRQQINYDKIEANVPVEASIFKMPPSKS
jgi:hypothetical protein